MVSEEKIAAFLKLQQGILDIEDSARLLELSLPKVLENLRLLGYQYIFLSAILTDGDKSQKVFFVEQNQIATGAVTDQSPVEGKNIFQKGSEWELKVMYGEAVVVSDISYFINPSYPQYQQIKSLLILPIMHARDLKGVLVLASSVMPDKITQEEIEFGIMVTRLIDLSFRLQDTERASEKVTREVYEVNAKLHQLDKLKDDFVSIASHELRTPMTAIRSYAWMALHRSDIPLSPKLQKYLTRTLISTERLINLVNDMLNVSRIESGRIEVNPKPFDIQTLVDDVLVEVGPKAGEKTLHLSALKGVIPQVFADPDKVHQVLLNLVGNAMKFTPVQGSITISFFSDGKTVEVLVKDSGVGISKDDLARLFKKFGRLDNSYTAAATSGGTGLGLFISKSLVELMKGSIWATSEGEGKGATFIFSLPAATPEVLTQAADYTRKVEEGEAKPLEPVAI